MSWLYPVLSSAPDECPTSFVSRLAKANFATSAREFCRDIGISFQALANGCTEAFELLAELTGFRTAELDTNAIWRGSKTTTLRGEKLLRTSIRRAHVFICPTCLKADIQGSKLPPDQAAYGRIFWRLAALHTCPAHGVALREIAHADAASLYDFSLLVRPRLHELDQLEASASRRPASGLERYLVDRLDKRLSCPSWIDGLDLFAVIKVAEMFGVAAMFSRKQNLKTLTVEDWRAAGAKGFDIIRNGEPCIRDFLAQMHGNYRESRVPNEGPHARFGKLYEWLAAVGDQPAYIPVRNLLHRCIAGIMPLGPGDTIFGQPIQERLLHSIRTASLETGMHPMPLRRALEATGFIRADQKHLKDHRILFDAKSAAPILTQLTGAISLKETETYLNAGRVHTKLLLDHGFIKPLLGDAAKNFKTLLFATTKLDQFMLDLLSTAQPVSAVPPGMFPIATAAKHAQCSAMDIVRLLLARKLKQVAALVGTQGYASVLVTMTEVRDHFRKPGLPGMTAHQVMTALGTFHAVVRALIDHGALPATRVIHPATRRPVSLVKRTDLDAFNDKYISLADLSKTLCKHPRTVRRELECKSIHPAPELDKKTFGIVFYRRSDL